MFARLDVEHDNLRAALTWSATEPGRATDGLRIGAALRWFWFVRGYHHEGRERLAGLLTQQIHTGLQTAPQASRERARALMAAAYMTWWDSPPAARRYIQEGLALSRSLGDELLQAGFLFGLGFTDLLAGAEPARTISLLQEGVELARRVGNRPATYRALFGLARWFELHGDVDQAIALQREAIGLEREQGDRRWLASSLSNLGVWLFERGELEEALATMRESLVGFQLIGDQGGMLLILEYLGAAAAAEGQADRALHLAGAATALRGGHRVSVDDLQRRWLADRLADARAALGDGAAIAWAVGQHMTLDGAVAEALAPYAAVLNPRA